MKLRLDKLILQTTSNREIVVPFSKNITYIHGESMSGKSSIVRLIDYCFGGNFELTRVLKKEFQSAVVECNIGNYQVILKRQVRSNEVFLRYRKSEEEQWQSKVVPIDAKDKPLIAGTAIKNLSDFIFYLSDKTPIMVRKSRTREDSQLIRLSIRDLLEYCYLEQENMVNSLFNLNSENYAIRLKSQDTLDLILGYHRDEISQLQIQLDGVYAMIKTKEETATNLQSLLEANQIQDASSISKSIEKLKTDKERTIRETEAIRIGIEPKRNHALDDLRSQALTLSLEIVELSSSVEEYKARIAYEEKLKNDFANANVHNRRANTIRTILKDASFGTCPQCGVKLDPSRKTEDHCSLCLQSYDSESSIDSNAIDEDLINRISELEESIQNLSKKKDKLELHLKNIKEGKNEIDSRISQATKEYDSLYLSNIRELDRKAFEIDSEIQLREKYLQFSQQVEILRKERDELVIKEDVLKESIKKAKEKASADVSNLLKVSEKFLDTLINSKMPTIRTDDNVFINIYDFVPRVKHQDKSESHFFNLGSAGQKTIFKIAFAVALHRFASTDPGNYLPTLIIVDSPMQHISEKVDKVIFEHFYDYLYKLASTELNSTQIIIIDKEYREPIESFRNLVSPKLMTRGDKDNPPLIPWNLETPS